MSKIVTKGDSRPLGIEKKSKKSKKNKIHNLQDINEDEDVSKDKKLKSVLNEEEDFSKDKKLKSVLNEDEDLSKDKRLKSVLNDEDEDFSKDKKLKSVLNEDEDEDENFLMDKKLKSVLNEDEDFSKDKKLKSVLNEDEDFLIHKKLKSVLNEDGDEDEKSKGHDRDLANKHKKKRKHEVTENESNSKVKSKKVHFSGHVETFSSTDSENEKPKTKEDSLVRGKRFTPEEDKILQDAVLHYIKLHNLGKDGLDMVLNCNSYPKIRKCWKEIRKCLPHRPSKTIYNRAHKLFERGECKWTTEEIELLKECVKKHGNNWKMVAIELGKSIYQVNSKWQKVKQGTKRGGKWSQEEYQSLYELVNLNLQLKVASQEKRSAYGMLRDDIRWGAISDKLKTRDDNTCCHKWYKQLTSSLVAEDKWSNADDYRLIKALYDLDATCVEDVDWDCVLEHRPGDVCRKRWDQMVLHIGHHGSKPFSEQVEVLSQRYCPDLVETREAWDSIPSKQ